MAHVTAKNLIPLCILRILEQHSDESRHLTQSEIADRLEQEYDITAERKAISRTICHLRDEMDIPIESDRSGSWLTERLFEESELQMLADSVLANRSVSDGYTREIIEKLATLSDDRTGRKLCKRIPQGEQGKTQNRSVFYNRELIEEAIRLQKRISFVHLRYGIDKVAHRSGGEIVSPYYILKHGQYDYLVCLNELRAPYPMTYRLDQIIDVKISKTAATPRQGDIKMRTDPNQMVQAPFLTTEKAERITFLADGALLDEIVSSFDEHTSIRQLIPKHSTDERVRRAGVLEVTVQAGPRAVKWFAGRYADYVEVLSPAKIREEIALSIERAARKYLPPRDPSTLDEADREAVEGLSASAKAAYGIPIVFGSYQQTADGQKKPIRWRHIKTENGRALLLSESVLEIGAYDSTGDAAAWSTCELRRRLNDEFFHTAFSKAEQAQICTVTNHTAGEDTQDKVFCLSFDEAKSCFRDITDAKAPLSEYVQELCADWPNFCNEMDWWLRTPGDEVGTAAMVMRYGFVLDGGADVTNGTLGIRPAIWIRQ